VAAAAAARAMRRGAWRRHRVLAVLLSAHWRRLWRGSGAAGKLAALRLGWCAAWTGWWAALRCALAPPPLPHV